MFIPYVEYELFDCYFCVACKVQGFVYYAVSTSTKFFQDFEIFYLAMLDLSFGFLVDLSDLRFR